MHSANAKSLRRAARKEDLLLLIIINTFSSIQQVLIKQASITHTRACAWCWVYRVGEAMISDLLELTI